MCAYLHSEFENKNSEFSKNVAFGCYYRYTPNFSLLVKTLLISSFGI